MNAMGGIRKADLPSLSIFYTCDYGLYDNP